jgi:predicted DNA-binding transcriptional regulator AlpA
MNHVTSGPRATETPGRPGRWIGIRQIADDLGVSTSTVYKWSARGAPWFPKSIRLKNGDIRVRQDWYEHWLASQEVP